RTLCPVYSTTKPVAALVIAMLVERGQLEYDSPVANYWPEFAAEGKGAITVAEAMSHQSGLPGFADPIDPALWTDPPKIADALARLYSAYAQKGRIGETRVIAPATWEELTRTRVSGKDRILPGRTSLAAGVMRNVDGLYGPNPNTLWHSGWGGSGAFGDPDKG